MAEPTPIVAAGVRAEWVDLPAHVRAAVEDRLGSPVREAVNQRGGFSPGMAARLRCADGTRAFVKAAGTSLNPDSPVMYRTEARIAGALPASAPVPRLRGVFDDGDWVALVFDEAPGRMPETPWSDRDVRRVLAALVDMAALLTPCPVAGLPTVGEKVRPMFTGYARLAEDPPADLSPWERRNLDRLAQAGTSVLDHLTGDTLVHLDVRSDNLLLGPDGAVHVVDWPWGSRGPAWVDTVQLLLNVCLYGGDPEPYLEGHPLLDGVDPRLVTGVLAGMAALCAEAHRKPPPPGLPTVREFQRVQGVCVLSWIRRRTGWS